MYEQSSIQYDLKLYVEYLFEIVEMEKPYFDSIQLFIVVRNCIST